MKKVGILGGTFNPVHNGHLFVAEKVTEYYHLDKLILIPNGNPPHKQTVSVSAEDRLAMLELAAANREDFFVDTYEVNGQEYSYTYNTLGYLKKKYPDDKLYFIAGADNIDEIAGWRRPKDIFLLADVIFFARPHYPINWTEIEKLKKDFHASIEVFSVDEVDISATDIRNRIEIGKPITGLVPPQVEQYIKEHRLYQPEYMLYMKQLKEFLCPKRFRHTIGVAKMAEKLAVHYQIDKEKAYLAGLLHDCAKNLPEDELRNLTKRSSFPIYDGELDNPQLLHSIAGSVIAKEVFEIEDKEILSAIRYHTIGRVDMTLLEKIIYLADLIEENRTFALVERMRTLAFINLDQALLLSIENNINYLKKNGLNVLKESYHIKESLLNKGVHL